MEIPKGTRVEVVDYTVMTGQKATVTESPWGEHYSEELDSVWLHFDNHGLHIPFRGTEPPSAILDEYFFSTDHLKIIK